MRCNSKMAGLLLVVLAAGCSDRFSAGDKCVLIGNDVSKEEVYVKNMPDHRSANPSLRAFHEVSGTPTTAENLPAGTRASVVADSDEDSSTARDVKVKLLEEPFAGLTGTVKRENLKKE